MQIVEMNLDELRPYSNNPRNNDNAVDPVANSIKEFGFKVPIVATSDGEIINGHTRYKAAKKLGLETVPVIIADDLTEEQIKAFRLADNKTGEIADWDFELLSSELEELLDFELTLFGFDDLEDFVGENFSDIEDVEECEYNNELQATDVKVGDIFKLGRHRLACGDSTDSEHIKRLLNGVKVDTVYTDPPYGMKKEKDGIQNDNLNYDDLLEFNKRWIPLTFDVMREVGSWYCWGIDEPLMDIYSQILRPMKKKQKITFRNLLTWDKGNGQGQKESTTRMYPRADEKCLFVMKGLQGINNNSDNYYEGYEVIRMPLAEAAERVGLTPRKCKEITGKGMFSHWFTKSQWTFIPQEHHDKLKEYYGKEWIVDYDRIKRDYDRIKRDYDRIKKDFYASRAFFDATHANFNNVLHFNRTSGKEREETGGHATPKPLDLVRLMLQTSTRRDDSVLDVFGGSGSTLIACEQLGRTCYMNELDPKYAGVIIRRWETLTGQKAVKLN